MRKGELKIGHWDGFGRQGSECSWILIRASLQVLIWNVSSGDCLTEIECHEDVVYSLAFNLNGSLLATTCKDKLLRVMDARSGQVLQVNLSLIFYTFAYLADRCYTSMWFQEVVCHEGGKAAKVVFLNDKKKLLTTGFSRTSHRQFAVWDQVWSAALFMYAWM